MDEIVQLIEIPKLVEMGECVDGLDWLDWVIWFKWHKSKHRLVFYSFKAFGVKMWHRFIIVVSFLVQIRLY